MRTGARLVLLTAVLATATGPGHAQSTLAPYQMVRSLQLVQDRIADGDHAALPMQNKLLAMIDQRMRTAETGEFTDRRNFEALLVYGMSGGNPVTIDRVLARIHPEEADRTIAQGVLAFLSGQPQRARSMLNAVEPMRQPLALGAPLALVKGAVTIADDPSTALRMLDQARLLGTGTLVEEAALRRTLPIVTGMRDADRFLTISADYVRTYLRSPYASEFANAFVAGILELYEILDRGRLDDVIAGMTPDQQRVIYLRLARKGAIDGIPKLSAFADAPVLRPADGPPDARAELYASMASMGAVPAEQLAARLAAIDVAALSAGDRQLLDATRRVVDEVLTPPTAAHDMALAPASEKPVEEASDVAVEAPAPATERQAHEGQTDADHAAQQSEPAPAPDAHAGDGQPDPNADPASDQLVAARKKLEEVDALLKEATR